jgi:hypothetical protein
MTDKVSDNERSEILKKAGRPNENHKRLAEFFAGDWDYVTKSYFEPGARAQESKGSSKVIPVYEGRFLQWTDEGTTAAGEKFQAMGNIGYDWPRMVMFRTQYSNQSTAFAIATGEWPQDSNEIRLKSSHHVDHLTGARDAGGARIAIAVDGPARHTIRAYEWAPDGSKEYIASESVYTRRK